MNNPYLLRSLELGPVIVARIVGQIPADKYDSHSDPARFTLREAIAHLADWEQIDFDRIRLTVDQPGATLTPYDETARAEEKRYTESDVNEQLRIYGAGRRRTLEYLRALPPQAWAAAATHPERGAATVYDQANLIVGHETYHIEHLTQYLQPSPDY